MIFQGRLQGNVFWGRRAEVWQGEGTILCFKFKREGTEMIFRRGLRSSNPLCGVTELVFFHLYPTFWLGKITDDELVGIPVQFWMLYCIAVLWNNCVFSKRCHMFIVGYSCAQNPFCDLIKFFFFQGKTRSWWWGKKTRWCCAQLCLTVVSLRTSPP